MYEKKRRFDSPGDEPPPETAGRPLALCVLVILHSGKELPLIYEEKKTPKNEESR